jgi:hypothetical protein
MRLSGADMAKVYLIFTAILIVSLVACHLAHRIAGY